MVDVFAHGENAFRLVNSAGNDIGWVRSKAIGFGGFATEARAVDAALDGGRALASCLKREFGVGHPALSDAPTLRTVRDGAHEWIVDGRERIARLLRMETGRGVTERFAIEFALPSYATDAVAINAAQIVYGALSPELTGGLDPHVVAATIN